MIGCDVECPLRVEAGAVRLNHLPRTQMHRTVLPKTGSLFGECHIGLGIAIKMFFYCCRDLFTHEVRQRLADPTLFSRSANGHHFPSDLPRPLLAPAPAS